MNEDNMLSRHTLSANWNQALNKAIRYESAIERVRELHAPEQGPYDNLVCAECSHMDVDIDFHTDYPCLTIEALEDETRKVLD